MGSKVNYRPLIFEKVQEIFENCPEYNFGEVMHSVATQLSKRGMQIETKGDLLKISDEDLYKALCKSLKEESNEEPIN
jgi:hypothetical protein